MGSEIIQFIVHIEQRQKFLSFCSRGGRGVHSPPPLGRPNWADTPPGADGPPWQTPPRRPEHTSPEQTSLRADIPPDRTSPPRWTLSGRYASYWNAFLFFTSYGRLSLSPIYSKIALTLHEICSNMNSQTYVMVMYYCSVLPWCRRTATSGRTSTASRLNTSYAKPVS